MASKTRKAGVLAAAFMSAVMGFFGLATDTTQAQTKSHHPSGPTATTSFNAVAAVNKRPETKSYRFNIEEKTVNYSGKNATALSIDGVIPAPLIEANVGDTLRTTFCNKLDEESSVHWHGVLLPPEQDGVPHLNTKPIAPGTCHTFEFPVKHHGTYWYHSHTGGQEQRGVYGPIVFHPRGGEREWAGKEFTLVLSDWTDESPHNVLRNLRRDGDFYSLKKNTVQSWDKVAAGGIPAIKNRIYNSFMRMPPMDLSDVGYDAFLANGEAEHRISGIGHGDKVRLRVVNSAASSYFELQFAGGPITVVAADGVDVEPFKVDNLKIVSAETYDIIVSMPHDKRAYELRATSKDGTGFSSTILGASPDVVRAPEMPEANLLVQDHDSHSTSTQSPQNNAHNEHMGHGAKSQGPVRNMKEYELLRAVAPTVYEAPLGQREMELTLTGNMQNYTWSFDNKALTEADAIKIKKGESVRFVLKNETMMEHPLHLHGHFFRVLNGQGDFSPLKHTVNIPPHGTVTIEFAASEEKDWIFHCHNLYHMMSGMGRVISYENGAKDAAAKMTGHGDSRIVYADVTVLSNMTDFNLSVRDARSLFNAGLEFDYKGHYHFDPSYERYVGNSPFFRLFAGGDFKSTYEENHNLFVAGFRYTLPFMIESEVRVDHTGNFRLQLQDEIELTSRLSMSWLANTDKRLAVRFNYYLDDKRNLAISTGYDSQFRDPDAKISPSNGFGIGLKFRF